MADHNRTLASLLDGWRRRARAIKQDAHALFLACREPRTPWYARLLAAAVVAYAFSPIDLIPDFVPVLGYLDDLLLLPLGVWLVVQMIPADVLADCRERARAASERPTSRVAAAVIVALWLTLAAAGVLLAARLLAG
jgi:uncharacterized membrane protein YkvA (DUF1232 family)